MELIKSFATLLDEVLKENFDFVSHIIRMQKDDTGYYYTLSIPKPAKFLLWKYTAYDDLIKFKFHYRRIKKEDANKLIDFQSEKQKTITVCIICITCLNSDERKLTKDFSELLEKKLQENKNAENLNILLPIECYI